MQFWRCSDILSDYAENSSKEVSLNAFGVSIHEKQNLIKLAKDRKSFPQHHQIKNLVSEARILIKS